MKMNDILGRLATFLFGLIVILLLLEVGLRIVGVIYHMEMTPAAHSSDPYRKNAYTILCLGNSWTAGAEAPKGKSYPDDLQVLLDKQFKKGAIRVINYGQSNQNTAELLYDLESFLAKTKPDLILLQTGQPNWWNYYKYDEYLIRRGAHSGELRFFAKSFLYHSHVYRLFMALCNDIINKKNVQETHHFQTKECSRIVGSVCSSMDRRVQLDKQAVNKAIDCLKKQIRLYPKDTGNYQMLGRIYGGPKKAPQKGLEWFIKGMKAERENSGGWREPPYISLRILRKSLDHRRDKQSEMLRIKIDRFIEEYKVANPKKAYQFMRLTDDELLSWVGSDIKDIVGNIQRKNIKLILQNYPFDPKHNDRAILDSMLRDFAKALNIPFVDHSMIFKKMLDDGAKRDDYFARTHCNAEGYEVMAKNIYDKLMEEKLLERGGQNN